MAKRLVQKYTFIPAENKIILNGMYNLERFLLITNVTDNQTLFTFNDTVNGIDSISIDRSTEQTTIVLDYDTSSMSSTDVLQVFVEGDEQVFRPEEALVDPVHKLRVSNPENLIDTDFEYGLQSSKWETLELSNNVPGFFGKSGEYSLGSISIVRATEGSDVIRVTTTDPHFLSKGTPIDVQGLTSLTAEGKYLIQAVESDYVFTYKCRAVQSDTKNVKTPYTTIVPGQFYTGADVSFVGTSGIQTDTANQSTLSVATPEPHGFKEGSKFYMLNTVSPKTLILDATGSSTAADGFAYVDTANQETANVTPDLTKTNTKAVKGAYSLRFDASAVNISNSTITWTAHGFRENDCVMYVKPAGADIPIGGLVGLEVYYVTNPTTNTFQLKLTYNGSPITFTNPGSYTYGQAELMMVYEIYSLEKQYANYYNYFNTWGYAYGSGSNYSGWDLAAGTPKIGTAAPDYYVPYNRARYTTSNPFYSSPWYFWYQGYWYGTTYTSGMTQDSSTTYPSSFNFVEDFSRYESMTTFDGPASSVFYDRTYRNGSWRFYNPYDYWSSSNWYFNRGDMFMVPLNRDQEADTFYAENHGFTNGQNVTYSSTGTSLYYYTHGYGNLTSAYTPSTLGNGTYSVEVVNENRFRLKSGTTTIRIAAASGSYTVTGLRNRRTANTFYLPSHGLSQNNLLIANTAQGGQLPATTSGQIAYASTDGDLDVAHNIISSALDSFLDSRASRADMIFDGPNAATPFYYGTGSSTNSTMSQGFSHSIEYYDGSYGSWSISNWTSSPRWDTGEVEDAGYGYPISGQGDAVIMTPYVKDATIPFHVTTTKNPLNRYGYVYYNPRWNVTQTYTLDQRNTGTTNPTVWTTVGVNGATPGVTTDWRFARAAHYTNATGRDVIVQVSYVISRDAWDSNSFNAQSVNGNQTSSTRYMYMAYQGYNNINSTLIFRVPDAVTIDSTFLQNLDAYVMDSLYTYYRYPALTAGTTYKAAVVDNNRISLKTEEGVPVDITSVGVSGPAGDTSLAIVNNGTTSYTIDGVNNPTLYLKKGYTYSFTITAPGFPFWLQTTSGAYNSGAVLGISDGVTNNGAENGTIIYTVPSNAPEEIYYVCQAYSAMAGTVIINEEPAAITFLDVTNQIGNLDGVYTVTSVPTNNSFEFATNFKAGAKLLEVIDGDQTTNDYFKITGGHNLADGTPVVYSNNGNASWSGFVNTNTYYVSVIDDEYLQLSETAEDQANGIFIAIDWATVPTSTHILSSTTVNGLVTVPGTVSVTSGSSLVSGGTNGQFLTYYKAGDNFIIKDSSSTPGELQTYKISSVIDDGSLTLTTPLTFTNASAKHLVPTKLFVRPDGATTHRPFDGGVEIIAGTAPSSQIVRQTRKYFRYQSGKGIQISLAINFNPPTLCQQITAVTDTKCERDVGYLVDGAILDMAQGSTYWAYFNGIAEVNSKYLSDSVTDRITKAKTDILALPDVAATSTGVSRINAYFTEVLDIISNGRGAATAPIFSNPTNASANAIAAKDKILANMAFIEAEVNAYVAVNYPNADHDIAKCTRDIKYALYSFAHDILYGGNDATYQNARFFVYFDNNTATSGIAATHKQQTIDAYIHLASFIGEIVTGTAITPSVGNTETQVTSGANATSTEATAIENLAGIIEDVITSGITALDGYTKTVPSITWAASELQDAADAITTAKPTLILSYAAKITSKYPHNLSAGTMIKVEGSETEIYNGEHMITAVIDDFSFQYTLGDTPVDINPAGVIDYRPKAWTNSSLRAGLFDFQNGFFYEFDGQQIYAVRRNSTTQLSGTAVAQFGSNNVSGNGTNFRGQLVVGDKIVIRGQTYKVTAVTSNTDIVIQPKYRGVNTDGAVITKTVDTRVPQSAWNIDICDGNGPSNFLLDTTKIQMAYMDYSWYGAGKIRFGFKDTYGHVIYCHEFVHNNRETEAYMRSGNLPARYEIENTDTATYIPRLFHWGTSVIMDGTFDDDKAYLFTAKSDTLSFTNGQALTATTTANSTLTYTWNWANRRYDWFVNLFFATSDSSKFSVGTQLYNGTTSIGQVDSTYFSGSYVVVRIFIASQNNTPTGYPVVNSGVSVNIGSPSSGGSIGELLEDIPLISIRLAPSVDNGITGNIGERDIINRMQLQLKQVGLVLTHDAEVSLILNGSLSNINFAKVQSPSLSNLVVHAKGDTITGGVPIFSFRASGGTDTGSIRLTNDLVFDLSEITDLGNCILGGDGAFPNGPDLLTIAVRVIDTSQITATKPFIISGRLTWSESQA